MQDKCAAGISNWKCPSNLVTSGRDETNEGKTPPKELALRWSQKQAKNRLDHFQKPMEIASYTKFQNGNEPFPNVKQLILVTKQPMIAD